MATFAPISIEALESLRKTGMTDDAIAEQMAQSSPGFSSQLAKIRKKFAGDPAATTAYLNTRFYGVVDHAPDKPKGIVGRSLDRVYDNFQKDTQDIRTALDQNAQGQQGFLDTTLQVAGNLGSIVASPVAQPVQEAVGSLAKAAYENVPGVKPLLQEVGQSRLVQEGIAPAIRSASSAISQASESNPSLRTLGAVGEGISDLADVYGGVQAGKMAVKGGMQAVQAIPQIPRLAGQAIGTTARIGTQPIREGFGGFMQGVRGQVDDAAKAAAPMELSGVAKEAVSKGLDENVVRFAVEQAPETKKAMAAMVKAAKEGSTKLGGDTAHKEILGQYILNNTEHLLNEKKAIGDALGAMKKGMADDVLDMTDDLVALQEKLRDAGAVINEKGVITRLAADSDDNIPMLQEALNFLQPDDAGRVVRRFKDVDMWRSKMFKEMNSAKAKMQPSASGQSVFGFAEKVVNNLRRSAIKRAAKNNSRLLAYNDAYEELSTQTSKFLKSIGYKGKLDIDSITAKELRTGEIALRTLGNASAETRDVLRELTAMARKYGYTSKVDEMNLVRWADTIENLFPVTPTRSLQGGVSRGTKDALGNFTEDVIRSGARRGVIGAVSEKVMEGIDTFRGMTPENQYRLLLELLDDAPGSSMTPSPSQARSVIDVGGKIDDANSAQSLDELPKALPLNGANSAKVYDTIVKRGGVTIDTKGVSPSGGFVYAPNKATEFVIEKSKFSPQHVTDFVTKNSVELQKKGNYIGGWEDGGNIYLDVSRLESPSPDVIRKAQGSQQLAIYDIKNRKSVDIGKMENGVYTPLDEATNVFNRHRGEIAGANSAGGATGKPKVQGGRTRDSISITPTGTNVFVERQKAIFKQMSNEQKGRFLRFRNKAMDANREFADSVNSIQSKMQAESIWEPNLKSDGRAIEKAFDDLSTGQNVNFENIKDMNRAAFSDSDPKKLSEIFKEIERNFEITRVKNRFDKPVDGYRDILINVRLGNGTMGEIQLQLPSISKVKDLEHITYEKVRAIQGQAKKLNGDPIYTAEQLDTIKKLNKKMKDAYEKAWQEEKSKNPSLINDLRPLLDMIDSFSNK